MYIALMESRIVCVSGRSHIHGCRDTGCQQLIPIHPESTAMLKQMGMEINESGKQVGALPINDFPGNDRSRTVRQDGSNPVSLYTNFLLTSG